MQRSMLLERPLIDREADLGRGLSGRLFVANCRHSRQYARASALPLLAVVQDRRAG